MAGLHQDFAAAQVEPALRAVEVDIQRRAAVELHDAAVRQAQFALFAAGGHFVGQVIAEGPLLGQQAEAQAHRQHQRQGVSCDAVQAAPPPAAAAQQRTAGMAGNGCRQVLIDPRQLLPDLCMFRVGSQPAVEFVAFLLCGLAGVQAQLPGDGFVQGACRYPAHAGSP
ncbi:hypothetical protein D9M72_520820 [compost metagenome]